MNQSNPVLYVTANSDYISVNASTRKIVLDCNWNIWYNTNIVSNNIYSMLVVIFTFWLEKYKSLTGRFQGKFVHYLHFIKIHYLYLTISDYILWGSPELLNIEGLKVWRFQRVEEVFKLYVRIYQNVKTVRLKVL